MLQTPSVAAPSTSSGLLSTAGKGLTNLARDIGQEYRLPELGGKIVKGFNPFDASNISSEMEEFGEAIDAVRELKSLIRGPSQREKGEAGGAPGHPAFRDTGTPMQGTTLGQIASGALGEEGKGSDMLGSSVGLNLGDILSKPYMKY
jgi:hypothetical protein